MSIDSSNFSFYITQDSYFLPRGGDKKNPGGKIYNKINTLKTKSRKRKLEDEEHAKILKNRNNLPKEQNRVESATAREAFLWLQKNDSPCTTVLDSWKASFPVRSPFLSKANAQDELKKANLWRLITSEHGYQLVSNRPSSIFRKIKNCGTFNIGSLKRVHLSCFSTSFCTT